MDSRVAPSSRDAGALTPLGRRVHYRHQIQSLAYVNLDQSNGGVIRNLGDTGLAIQAVAPLYKNQQVFLRFDLANPRARIEATGRVAWADPVGQAGVEFVLLSPRSRRLLKEWILTQLLTAAQNSAGDATFFHNHIGQEATELLFSSAARPAIRLEAEAAGVRRRERIDGQPGPLHPWFPFAIPAPVLSRLVDGLILLSAVLLFALICIAMVGIVPAWPVALAMGLGVAVVFAALYRFLFLFWMGGTLGDWLAGTNGNGFEGNEMPADDRPRFR
ncbi:MAG: PilZ domain-containing protein [Terriglobales bacterium]